MSSLAYREAHREELVQKQQDYYERTRPQHGHVRRSEWIVPYEHKRARMAWRRATWAWGERVDWQVWLGVWSGTCFGCGKSPAEGVDHIIPKPKGGRNIESNLQSGCWPCNQRKSDG